MQTFIEKLLDLEHFTSFAITLAKVPSRQYDTK